MRARLVPLFDGESPSPLDSMIVDGRKSTAVYADLPTDGDGLTTARFESVSGGRYRSGTSYAAPFVSAALAAALDGDASRPADAAVADLVSGSADLGRKGRDPVFGWGLVKAPACGVKR